MKHNFSCLFYYVVIHSGVLSAHTSEELFTQMKRRYFGKKICFHVSTCLSIFELAIPLDLLQVQDLDSFKQSKIYNLASISNHKTTYLCE